MNNFFIFLGLLLLLNTMPINASARSTIEISSHDITNNLEFNTTVDGTCLSFSQSEDYLATSAGVFSTTDGHALIEFTDTEDFVYFSPDERWILADGYLYEVATAEPVVERNPASLVAFSIDGQYVHINYDTYHVETWSVTEDLPPMLLFEVPDNYRNSYEVAQTFQMGNGIPRYLSPLHNFWVVVNFVDDMESGYTRGGIYSVNTGERIDIPDELNDPIQLDGAFFSPDEQYFFAFDGEVYDTDTWAKKYQLNLMPSESISFHAHGEYFTRSDTNGIFATSTGELVFELDSSGMMSRDGQWVATETAIYEFATGDTKLEIQEPNPFQPTFSFSPNGNYALHFANGIYDLSTTTKVISLNDSMRAYAFSNDETTLYVQTIDQEIMIYDLVQSELKQQFEGTAFALSSDERYLAITQASSDHSKCSILAIQ